MGEQETLEQRAARVIAGLRARGLRVALVEASTGGLTAASLAAVPGASAVLERALVPYSNAAKEELLGVPTQLFIDHGAVSAEVARAMAEGLLARCPADVVLAETGIAGPGGGTAQKPVGLTFLALVHRGVGTRVERFQFEGERREVQRSTALAGLGLLEAVGGAG
ncbi:CinA family protein [Aggregicoccus sp. 17bor-14]|uniref:CinA family protein n=1 Tax=Myxococcaceae TaxID=31 RepID=UPI00129C2EC4|nr:MULTISPECIES: CinA family protein [Myxococcaceae]MBF5042167.1 CinA family protein [Simulacricoccus sp. 17bor-14]MRI87944.1 CinA family protein [Aggregicoccus sp. 17bor-14]